MVVLENIQARQNSFELPRRVANILFFQDRFVIAGTSAHHDPTRREAAPTHLPVVRTNQGMASGPEQHDLSVVRFGLILKPRRHMSAPKPLFLFGARREIHDVIDSQPVG